MLTCVSPSGAGSAAEWRVMEEGLPRDLPREAKVVGSRSGALSISVLADSLP